MEQKQWQIVAIAAGIIAIIAALATGRVPRWLRIVLVLALVILAAAGGLYGYRHLTQPATLTVAAGSFDGDAVQMMSMIATRLTAAGAPVRLKIVDKGNALDAVKAFSSGETDLAVARADIGDLSAAETVVVITRAVVLIVAPPGSALAEMDDLKGKTVGVIGGEVNRKVVEALTQQYDLGAARTQFKDLAVADVPQAIKSKQVNALLVVMPLTEKYLTMLRNALPKSGKSKPALISIEAAGAIAAVHRYYQSYDLPKGTISGSPPIPDDDMKTLHVPFYLVANKTLSNDVVAALAKAVMDARRDLIGAFPLIAQIGEPDTDKSDTDNDTYLPMHPGATAYFGGDEQTFFDKYGDQIFYGSLFLGTLTSLFAGIWKFMTKDSDNPQNQPLMRLFALGDRVRSAGGESELMETERQIDDILKGELEKYADGSSEPTEAAALGLATQRLQHLIALRRSTLGGGNAALPEA
jgi:TRAP-type uncharacterized transport system substrate-binding protein